MNDGIAEELKQLDANVELTKKQLAEASEMAEMKAARLVYVQGHNAGWNYAFKVLREFLSKHPEITIVGLQEWASSKHRAM
jgi:hypothetical protein